MSMTMPVESFAGVVESERIKASSLRATTYLTGAMSAAIILLGVSSSVGQVAAGTARPVVEDPIAGALAGVGLAQLLAGALGILVVTSEYSGRTIHTTLVAVPRRSLVVVAKALVAAVLVFSVGLLWILITYVVNQVVLVGPEEFALPGDVARVLVGGATSLSAIAVLGTGFGWLLRSSLGAAACLVSLLYLPVLVAAALPLALGSALSPYLPANAGSALMALSPGSLLTPTGGVLVLGAYSAALLTLAGAALGRRDV